MCGCVGGEITMQDLIEKYTNLRDHYRYLYVSYEENGFVDESLRYQDMYLLCARIIQDLEGKV